MNLIRSPHLMTVAMGALLIVLNLSGDHLFYKTNTLKLFLLCVFCYVLCVSSFLQSFRGSRQLSHKAIAYLLLASLPIVATLPGLFINGAEFRYFSLHEYAVHSLTVLWGFLLLSRITSIKSINLFIYLLIGLVSYLFLVGFLQAVGFKPQLRFGLNVFERLWLVGGIPYEGDLSRISATAGNPNYLAGMLIQLLPLFGAFYLVKTFEAKSYASWHLLPTICALFVTFFLCLLAGSRAAFIGLFVSCIVFFCLARYFLLVEIRRVFLVSLMGVVCAAALFVGSELVARIITLGTDGSSLARLSIWQAAINSIQNAPLLGHGLGTSYSLFFSFADPEIRLLTMRSFVHAHNDLLEVWQEGGLLGLGAYLFFWGYLFVVGWQYLKSSATKEAKLIVLGLLCGLMAVQLQGLFSVAPRMVVTRVISYSLVALLFYLLPIPNWLNKIITALPAKRTGVNLTLLAIPLLSAVWLADYLPNQFLLAKLIAKPEVSWQSHYQPTENSYPREIYWLDRAIDSAQAESNYHAALEFSQALNELIPNFRDVHAEIALNHFSLGHLNAAEKAATHAYKIDRYHEGNVQLLIHLALQNQNPEAFKGYSTDLLNYHLCRVKLANCNDIKEPKQQIPILRLAESLSLLMLADSNDPNTLAVRIANQLSQSSFAQAKLPSQFSKSQQRELSKLVQVVSRISKLEASVKALSVNTGRGYLADRQLFHRELAQLNKQLALLKHERETISASLPEGFDVGQFLSMRKWLIGYSKALSDALQFGMLHAN